jgi:uncharacterized repeat protein (TIGR04138 family)
VNESVDSTMSLDQIAMDRIIGAIRRRNPRFSERAYYFVLAALQRYLEALDRPRHVSGRELADAVRGLALDTYGPMARTVLEHWGVHSTAELGEIVFLLVDNGVLTTQPGDSREDFEGLYSFEEAFEKEYPWGQEIGPC